MDTERSGTAPQKEGHENDSVQQGPASTQLSTDEDKILIEDGNPSKNDVVVNEDWSKTGRGSHVEFKNEEHVIFEQGGNNDPLKHPFLTRDKDVLHCGVERDFQSSGSGQTPLVSHSASAPVRHVAGASCGGIHNTFISPEKEKRYVPNPKRDDSTPASPDNQPVYDDDKSQGKIEEDCVRAAEERRVAVGRR